MFEETGCKHCRNAWTYANRESILVRLGKDNYERQARLHSCSICGTYWEEPNGSYPVYISEADAKQYYGV